MVTATSAGSAARAEIADAVEAVGLVDHHVHGVTFTDLDAARFESLITESDRAGAPGTSQWDSQVGFAIRRWCAPLLDLEPHAAGEEYLARRRELGADEVNRRLLRACGVEDWLIDTGFGPDQILDVPAMAEATGGRCREVVRLEAVAESLARSGVDAAGYADALGRAIADAVEAVGLVDHHVHGVTFTDLDPARFERLITESDRAGTPGTSQWDSQVGFAIRRWCAPLLDLEPHAAGEEYLARRRELGAAEVNRRLLRACGVEEWLIDTGFGPDQILDVPAMAEATGGRCREVVRLEAIAESLARSGVDAAGYTDAFGRAVADAVGRGAVGTKSVMAYRCGFDIDHARPAGPAVTAAAGAWLADVERSGSARLTDPTLIAHGVWTALDLRVPLQLHVGLGDTDLDLHRADPLLLTPLFRASEALGTPILLLHCWPFHREAGYLAQMFPHAYFDVGEALNYVGAQSRQVVAESLEVAPFGKQLYSSDGWGPAELHYLGARLWRRAMTAVTSAWVEDGDWSAADARRVVELIGAENARRIYPL